MRETVALCRETLGGNGIQLDHGVARYMADAEAVFSFEGTYDMNQPHRRPCHHRHRGVRLMAEAYIVATARSPIGRAFKGSLTDVRPDDLAASMVRAALAQVPALDPGRVEDLLLGCGMPGGEQGMNMARIVAVLLGLDSVPGTTVNRYCSSSLQTTRMAFHAIKAGEGDVFVSAGVECVSRSAIGNSDYIPGVSLENPRFADATARTAARAASGDAWVDPRESGLLPDAYIAMGQTAENVAALTGTTRRDQDEFAALSPEPRREGAGQRVLGRGDHARDPAGRHGRVRRRRPPRRCHGRGAGRPEPRVPARRHGHGGQLLPAQRRCGCRWWSSATASSTSSGSPRSPASSPPASAGCRPRSWASDRSTPPGWRWPAPG